MAESRITDFFTAAPVQKRSRQESSDSDSEAVGVPCPVLATSTASDTSVSTGSGATSSVAVFTRKGKHKVGYDPKWNKEFDWLEYRNDTTDFHRAVTLWSSKRHRRIFE